MDDELPIAFSGSLVGLTSRDRQTRERVKAVLLYEIR
jgi:hypothetical protein